MGNDTVSSLNSVPRAVVSLAIGVAHTVERAVGGEQRTRVAQANAWAAVHADRERARRREEVRLAVAALAAHHRTAPATDGPDAPVTRRRTGTRRVVS